MQVQMKSFSLNKQFIGLFFFDNFNHAENSSSLTLIFITNFNNLNTWEILQIYPFYPGRFIYYFMYHHETGQIRGINYPFTINQEII